MPEMTLTQEEIGGISGDVAPGIRLSQIMGYVFSGMKTASHEDSELEKTIRTLTLAAEPGERYPAVAERIAREAEIYRDFLRRPRPIGKISLTVKELDPNSPDFTSPREQLRVHDPSEGKRDPGEGCASVGYTFNRSATKVLEFVVHDEDGAPLFAIARTYSNWLGSREFTLGPNRFFYLNMVEVGDAPGYVMVQAGFRHAHAGEVVTTKPKTIEPRRLTPVIDKPEQSSRGWWWAAPYGPRVAYLFGLQCLVVSLLCCSVFWVVTGRAMAKTDSPETWTASASQPVAALPITPNISSDVAGFTGGSRSLGAEPQTRTGRNARVRLAQRAQRLAQVKVLSISIDNDSCKLTQGQCVEWLSTVQKGVKSSLSDLSVPISTPDPSNGSTEPARLIVSYTSTGLIEGQIHLTLYDRQGALWHDDGSLSYTAVVEPAAVSTYCEEASSEMVWEIIAAKMQVSSGNDLKGAVSSDKSPNGGNSGSESNIGIMLPQVPQGATVLAVNIYPLAQLKEPGNDLATGKDVTQQLT